MKILDLFIYILEELSKTEFMFIIFGCLSVMAVFGLIDRKLR